MPHNMPNHWDRNRALTLADIRGWRAISYSRFSSSLQEGNDSIARQQAALSRAISDVGLALDTTLEDRAQSASKGHHRTKGELGRLLAAIHEGAVPSATVLIVENVDRLTRESVLDAYTMLATMIRAGIVLLVCGDDELELYDEAAINGRAGDRLYTELRAAYKYTRRLGQLQRARHERRREQAARGEHIIPNGIVPGWLDRDLRSRTHTLNQHASTIERIFRECREGASAKEIAAGLNRDDVPTMRGSAMWRAPRVGTILRDDAALGYWSPIQWRNGRRVPVGSPALVYPPAVTAELWQAVQDALSARKGVVRGAAGKTVPNLFTGRAFCGSCNASLRIDTGGGYRGGKRKRHLLCGAYMEAKTCADATRYDLNLLERPILWNLIEMMRLAPSPMQTRNTSSERIAALHVQIGQRETSILGYLRNGSSPTMQRMVETLAAETDDMRREVSVLKLAEATLAAHRTAAQQLWPLMRATIIPALDGDLTARDHLRGLLSRHAYKITGDRSDSGGLVIRFGAAEARVHPDNGERDRLGGMDDPSQGQEGTWEVLSVS